MTFMYVALVGFPVSLFCNLVLLGMLLALSRRVDRGYAHLARVIDRIVDRQEEDRDALSTTWRYAEAIDDVTTGGQGNHLHLQRMHDKQSRIHV